MIQHRIISLPIYFWVACSNLPKQFVMTSQQLEEELQEASGVDQIFIPHKNQRLAESLQRTGKTLQHCVTSNFCKY